MKNIGKKKQAFFCKINIEYLLLYLKRTFTCLSRLYTWELWGGGCSDQVRHVKIYLINFLLTNLLSRNFIYDACIWRIHKLCPVKCFTKKISAELFFHDVSLLILIVFHIKIVKKWNAAFMIIISGRLI